MCGRIAVDAVGVSFVSVFSRVKLPEIRVEGCQKSSSEVLRPFVKRKKW
jgi:hypothetical protein